MKQKTLIFILSALLGVALGEMSSFASELAIAAFMLAGLQLLLLGIGKWRSMKSTAPFFIFLCACGITLGIIRTQLVEERSRYVCPSACSFDAVIVTSPETKDVYQIFAAHPVATDDNMLHVQVRAPLYPRYEIGQTIRLTGKVTIPEVLPPHKDVKAFDYAAYLRTRNIGSTTMYPGIEIIDTEAHDISALLGRFKNDMVGRIETYVSSPASAFASGMLFGASSLSTELTTVFRTVGLSHVVVLSGFNIALVIAFILFVFAFVPLFLRIVLASGAVIIFVIMVGGEASVIRATLMAFIALLAMLVGRAYVASQALLLSLFAIVMYEPYALLHDVSLHLSFLATAGIVYGSRPIGELLAHYVPKMYVTVRELFTTTLVAYLTTLPYICYTFGTVSLYALLANMLVLPLVPIAMLLSFLVVVTSYVWHPIALGIGLVDSMLINVMLFFARVLSQFPYASIALRIDLIGMWVAYIAIILLTVYLYYRHARVTRVTTTGGILTDVISY